MKRIVLSLIILSLLTSYASEANEWTTHFAYNDFNQIEVGGGTAYAVSSGSLLAIDIQTEKIKTLSSQDGMHGNNIACIKWLERTQALMIVYADGKVDILNGEQFHYIPDLYNKFTTFNKLCHSVTIRDSLAYMAMEYGIQTFNIRKREFTDTYLIGQKASATPIHHIAFTKQNIYAAGDTTLYGASLSDNIVDYSLWTEIQIPSRKKIQGIAVAGEVLYLLQNNICYRYQNGEWSPIDDQKYAVLNVIDDKLLPAQYPIVSYNGLWMAAGDKGVIRQLETGEQITYKLDGPLNNTPYRLMYQQGNLYMLSGGRWASQNKTPGCVMRYDGSHWHNISQSDIVGKVGNVCRDMMNVAVDPSNPAHYFATSYGTGLYEFLDDECIKRWTTTNSILESSAPESPNYYTRTDAASFDEQGNLWVMNAGNVTYNIVIFTTDGQQVGMNVNKLDGTRALIQTVGQIVFDQRNPNYVWTIANRSLDGLGGLALIDTKGTIHDTDDDQSLIRTSWFDKAGNQYERDRIYCFRQDQKGNIWIGTNNGILIIPESVDYFLSALCSPLHVTDDEGRVLFDEEEIKDIVFDQFDRPWIATAQAGVYVLSANADSVIAHYTVANSALPSNAILSLAYDNDHMRMYIGTSLGLVAYTDSTSDIPSANDVNNDIDYGSMQQWATHFAYTRVGTLQVSSKHVYALSNGSLLSVNKDDESLTCLSKLNGLNGSSIQRIDYDTYAKRLIITYVDGMIDLLDENELAHPVPDLYLKQMNALKRVQDVAFKDGEAYMAMPFGIMVMNTRKGEISDTYYIGDEGAELAINAIAIKGDSIYAVSDNLLYSACLKDNLVDYSQWRFRTLPMQTKTLLNHNDDLYMLVDSTIYRNFQPIVTTEHFASISASHDALLAQTADRRCFEIGVNDEITLLEKASSYAPYTIVKDGNTYWLGMYNAVWRITADESVLKYSPSGPSSNIPYSLTTYGSQLWMLQGGRWSSSNGRDGIIMSYNGKRWTNISSSAIRIKIGEEDVPIRDFGHMAIDPADPKHYYVSSFGTGLYEFLPDGTAKHYTYNNSPLATLVPNRPEYYCRTDALSFDADRNLWLTNTGDLATNIHIIDPQNKWHSFDIYQNGQRIILTTVSKLLTDNRYPNYKWIASARLSAGLLLINDNGTPYDPADDRTLMRATFVDQDNKSISLMALRTIAQDYNGDMWLGTSEGIIIIDATTDFFRSDACRRMKISRHDGTNLADYLLGTEQVNAIVFAGGNRIWIGTETSGVYLIHMVTKEGIYEPEVLAHFTTLNSPMPSDCVLSIAVDAKGEVYIGTDKGLVAYRGDASEPEEEYTGAYVYPNPVRPNFEGTITIAGLMDNTTVYIADAAGNVVCRTHSNGGTAIWDGKTLSGKKAHTGVYTIYCNTADGKGHTVLKLLLMH